MRSGSGSKSTTREWLSALGLSLLVWGCGGPLVTEAVVVEPAALPLRAYPQVLVVPGPLSADTRVARSLARMLQQRGHTRVRIIDAGALRERTRRRALPVSTVIVELMVSTDERLHLVLDPYPRTTCDSLGCYQSPAGGGQDLPMVRATLHVTVREGRSMRVVQRMRLRVQEISGDYDALQQHAVLGLIARLRGAVEQLPRLVELRLASGAIAVDVPGHAAALRAVADGDFGRARGRFARVVARARGLSLSPPDRAALLCDYGQVLLADGAGADPAAARKALSMMARARALQPEVERYAEAERFARQAVDEAERVRSQRVAASRNFRLLAEAQTPEGAADDHP